jgi:hypothetical protein
MKNLRNYREFVRKQKRDIKNLTEGRNFDSIFENKVNSLIEGQITTLEFETYLEHDLYLNINENYLINENLASEFANKVISKVKSLFNNLYKKIKENDGFQMLVTFTEKVTSGLSKFWSILKKIKWGQIIKKLLITLGITSIVSYILSQFSVGWVAMMGARMGSSVIGAKVADKVVDGKKPSPGEKPSPDKKKSLWPKIGTAILNFFKLFKRLKWTIVIFFGVVFVLNLIFNPLFEPILKVAKVATFSTIFSDEFEQTANAIVTIPKVTPSNVNIDLTAADKLSRYPEVSSTVKTAIGEVGESIKENPKEASQEVADLINNTKQEVLSGQESNDELISSSDDVDVDSEQDVVTGDEANITLNNLLDEVRVKDYEYSEEVLNRDKFYDNDYFKKIMQDCYEGKLDKALERGTFDWQKAKDIYLENGVIKEVDGNYYDGNELVIFPGDKTYNEMIEKFDESGGYPLRLLVSEKVESTSKMIISNIKSGDSEAISYSGFFSFSTQTYEEGPNTGKKSFMLMINQVRSENDAEGMNFMYFPGIHDKIIVQQGDDEYEASTEKLGKIIEQLFPEKIEEYNSFLKSNNLSSTSESFSIKNYYQFITESFLSKIFGKFKVKEIDDNEQVKKSFIEIIKKEKRKSIKINLLNMFSGKYGKEEGNKLSKEIGLKNIVYKI